MRKYSIILIFIFFPFWIQSEKIESVIYYQSKNEFAISLCFGANNSYLNYAVVVKSGNKIIKSQQLTEQSFMMQMTGKMNSNANPKLKNLLKENVLDTCDCVIDNLYKKYVGYNCEPFRLLWKVRYKYDPKNQHLKNSEDYKGWAYENYSPGVNQSIYLKERYGIQNLNDFIAGEKLYLLLNDVQDSTWVNDYYYKD